MIALGPEMAAKVFRHLKPDEMETISLEIANQRTVTPDERDMVLQEFYQMAIAQSYIAAGGLDYARELLEKALGPAKAMEILQRLTASLQVRPFDLIRKADPSQLLSFIQNEHPQTIALIMAYLHPDQAATVLSALPPERQADVARRIAIMDRTSPEVLKEVERVLERKLASLVSQDYTVAGGVEAVVEILNRVDRGTEKTIMEALAVQDPSLADEIKKRMFLFEDIVHLDNRTVQRILREVDMNRDLPLALKVASEEVKQKIFRNISKRAAENLRESMEYLGPVRLRDVEEAQAKIVNIIRRLEEEGEIVIARGGGDDIVV
ncbi:MAG: flagellar motor switch protein FliG [Firmicutes bacterium]|nr:flagellar motor switch protein FliG [Bacillota bacterium]